VSEIATEAGHWYIPPDKPYYTYTNKNGEEKNVTLREARKAGAGPSVSAIIRCAYAYALEKYKMEQVALAAAENPRGATEGVQAYMDRILALGRVHAETARDLGTEIHGDIEKALTDTVWIPRPEASAAIKTLCGWCGGDSLRMERSFFHPLGYGGKCDVQKDGFVADFKSKDFTESLLPLAWDNHAQQLSAYREGFGMPKARCAIIYVSTSQPGLCHLIELPEKELQRGWEMFCHLLEYWKVKNNYDPSLRKEPENGKRERLISA
jgi:hypothetical protein